MSDLPGQMETNIRVTCVCGQPAVLRTDRRFYANKPAWFCSTFPEHYAYVGAHQKTLQPMGTLADAATHGARFQLHEVFDPIWKSGYMTRTEAYQLMGKILGVKPSNAHIGYMTKEVAEATKIKINAWLEENIL